MNFPVLSLNPSVFLSNLKLDHKKALVLCLGIGFFVRLVPELLAYPYPIGFDSIHYAVRMQDRVILEHWSRFFTSSWLFYFVSVPLYSVFQADPFLILKILVPLAYGLNVAGVYWFSQKNLKWTISMSVLAGLFFALQLASLRISWDLFRNILGMGILLFALSYVKEVYSKKGFALFTLFSLLSVFAHEYAAVTLVFVVLGILIWPIIKRQADQYSPRLLLGLIPALIVFGIGLYLRITGYTFPSQSNIVWAKDLTSGKVGLFFLVNYLETQTSVDAYSSYFNLALNVGLLFAVLFVPYIILVLKGFFRNSVLDFWTLLLLIGSFSCLIIPFAAVSLWHRWMFMLVYPFTFYAINGLYRFYEKIKGKRFNFSWLSHRHILVMVFVTFALGIGYLATPILMNVVGDNFSVPSATGTYFYISTAPGVPYEDVEGVNLAMNWLNSNMDENSSVVLQHAYLFWGQYGLDRSHRIFHFNLDVDLAVNLAFEEGFERVYFVWWNEPLGWYGVDVPEYFDSVEDFGRISVYCY